MSSPKISPTSGAQGQSFSFQALYKSTTALSNVTLSLELRPVSSTGVITKTPIFSKVWKAQNFKANESRTYSFTYTPPTTVPAGKYTLGGKVISGDGKVWHLYTAYASGPYVFTITKSSTSPQPTATPKPAATATPKPTATPVVSNEPYLRGVNIMDLGTGTQDRTTATGVFNQHYTKTSLENFKEIARRGHKVVRLTFTWERIQPKLGGPLDAKYLGYLMENLRSTDQAGMKAIIDMHNYGRYSYMSGSEKITTYIGDITSPVGPTTTQYIDVWNKISAAIRKDAAAYRAVYAYDLMNEPHGIPNIYASLTQKDLISDFKSNLGGWMVTNGHAITAARIVRNGKPSMRITIPKKVRQYNKDVYSMVLYKKDKAILEQNGNKIRVTGFIPTTTEGSFQARFVLVDGKGAKHVSTEESFRKGRDGIYFNADLPAAGLKGTSQLIMELLVSQTPATSTAPQVVYIDRIAQGTAAATVRGKDVWIRFAQAAVKGLRDVGDKKLIHVEGYEYSSAARWAALQPKKFITDPANNLMYHAHLYLDTDASGHYLQPFSKEEADAKKSGFKNVGERAVSRAKSFADWCTREKVRCFIGEYGWPNSDSVGSADSKKWDEAGEALLKFLDSRRIGATAWATGSWLKADGNINNIYVLNFGTSRKFTPLSPAAVIERHPSR